MLPAAALDALSGRHAEAVTAHLLFPLELRRLVVDAWVPDEIEMQHLLEVETLNVLSEPRVGLLAVNGLENAAGILLFLVVARDQSAVAFRDFKSCLQPHRPFRKGSMRASSASLVRFRSSSLA